MKKAVLWYLFLFGTLSGFALQAEQTFTPGKAILGAAGASLAGYLLYKNHEPFKKFVDIQADQMKIGFRRMKNEVPSYIARLGSSVTHPITPLYILWVFLEAGRHPSCKEWLETGTVLGLWAGFWGTATASLYTLATKGRFPQVQFPRVVSFYNTLRENKGATGVGLICSGLLGSYLFTKPWDSYAHQFWNSLSTKQDEFIIDKDLDGQNRLMAIRENEACYEQLSAYQKDMLDRAIAEHQASQEDCDT